MKSFVYVMILFPGNVIRVLWKKKLSCQKKKRKKNYGN